MAKVNLFHDFKEFLESLNSGGVKYLLLGGYAVNHYGYRRATDDLDIWIDIDLENATRVAKLLREFGGFSAAQVKPKMFLEPHKIFIIGREPVRIDILTSPDGIDFASCYDRRRMILWDGVRVPLISLGDLRVNKSASGRLKDLADLEGLKGTIEHVQKRVVARKSKGGAVEQTRKKRKR